MNVAQTIVSSLESLGTNRIYGLVGVSILDLLDAIKESPIRYISTRHEQVAVSMADAEGRILHRPGVAVVHAGPGLLNSMISIANAYKDSSPLLVISGGVKRRMKGLDSWLEVDQSSMLRPITKYYARVERPSQTSKIITEAYSACSSPPYGPAVVEIPEDLWGLDAGNELAETISRQAEKPKGEEVMQVAKLLEESSKPVLLAGGGVNNHDAAAYLSKLCHSHSIPVIVTGNGRGSFPEDDELFVGKAGFGGGSTAADYVLEEADLVVAVGAGISDVTTYGYIVMPKGKKVVVDLDGMAEKKPVQLTMHLQCDATSFLKMLLDYNFADKRREEWLKLIAVKKREWEDMLNVSASKSDIGWVNPSKFFRALNSSMPDDAIVTAGQGVHIVYAYDYLKIKRPNSFLAATNLGAMGFAFPAALGAKVSEPDRTVIAVLGDGEFMMTVHDLETAVREKMGRLIGTLHSNPDFVKLAEAFGAKAMSISSDEQIEEAIQFLMQKDTSPAVLELKINPDEMPPLNLEPSSRF